MRYVKGWPEPYVHTVYDRMYGDFPAKNTCMVLANPRYV